MFEKCVNMCETAKVEKTVAPEVAVAVAAAVDVQSEKCRGVGHR